jgi:hypothetical protein
MQSIFYIPMVAPKLGNLLRISAFFGQARYAVRNLRRRFSLLFANSRYLQNLLNARPFSQMFRRVHNLQRSDFDPAMTFVVSRKFLWIMNKKLRRDFLAFRLLVVFNSK